MMRIGVNFHSSDNCISGVEYYALGLLRGLLSIEVNHEYLVYTNRPELVRQNVPPAPGLTVIPAARTRGRWARILWEHTELPRLAVRHRLDVLHCTSYICPLVKPSVPCVVTIHDTLALDRPQWCRRSNALYYGLVLRRSMRTAARVIAVSHQTAHDVQRHASVPASRIRVIHAGVDEIFGAGPDALRCRQVRTRYALPDRYVLYVGNIEPKKNVGVVLGVQQRLQARGLPHKLVIVGKRSWRTRQLRKDIGRGVASGGVVWVGYADRGDLPYIYRMADVFIFPSLYEGFGFPPLEAMACGTPVVTSGRGALAETTGGAATMVDPDDVEQTTAGVLLMLNDWRLRDACVEAGLKRSRQFTWTAAARATLSVYEEVAAGHDG